QQRGQILQQVSFGGCPAGALFRPMETWLILRAMFFQPLPKIFSQFAITSLPADRKYIIPVQGQWRKWSEQKILQRLNHHWIRLQAASQLSWIEQTTASMPIRVKSLS